MKHLFLAFVFVLSFSAMAADQDQDKPSAQQVNKELEIKSVTGGECHDTSMAGCPATHADLSPEESMNAKAPLRDNNKKGDKGPGKGIEIED